MTPLPRHTRFAAWLVTGPVGHFVGAIGDWGALFARYWIARARGREPFT